MLIARPIRCALALALALPLLGGCFVTSQNPVLRQSEDGRDPELRGLWVTVEGREFLHVLRPELRKDADEAPGYSGLYVVSEGEKADDRDNWTRVRIITTRVKGRGILSMRFGKGGPGGDMDEIPGWLIFAYELQGNRLYLSMIAEDPVDAAIKAGELAGTPKSGSGSDPHVTASAQEWIAFLKKADLDSLFKEDEDSFLVRLPADRIRAIAAQEENGKKADTDAR